MCYNGGMDKEVDGILVAAHELKAPLAVLRLSGVNIFVLK